MQDREVVAAIAAGDLDGLAEAYQRYAASLYACCRHMLASPEAAAGAVADTFIVAACRLDGLRDPGRLGAWLHAVARNECLRRLGPEQAPGPADPGAPGPADVEPAAVTLPPGQEPAADTPPAGLREQVLAACADNTPTGRAYRMSVAHRAGPFGPSGFPKAVGPSGPRWWRRVRRHPRAVAALAAVALVARSLHPPRPGPPGP